MALTIFVHLLERPVCVGTCDVVGVDVLLVVVVTALDTPIYTSRYH
jgi:hypothetical protein